MRTLQTPFSPFQPPHCNWALTKSLAVQSSQWYQVSLPCSSRWQPSSFTLHVFHVACVGSCLLLIYLVQVSGYLFCVILLPVANSAWYVFLTFCFILLTSLCRYWHSLVQTPFLFAQSLRFFLSLVARITKFFLLLFLMYLCTSLWEI